ncbi:MAG: type III pantothenate kinase [Candidatus Eremiobacteraeota bacterium]|nr:type III pantothenate kinase [Candidatus Eremiobacteraeota bacterium]
MLLCIDVGNTETKLGFFGVPASGLGLEMVGEWRVTTVRRRTSDEFGVLFAALFNEAGIALGAVRAIAMSSVVPQVDRDLRDGCKRYFKCEPLVLSAKTQTVMEVRTERPAELGADMLAAAIGARAKYGAPAIVIGYGTATTFSAISGDGAFLGTAIAPGIQIAIDALVARAAKLPQVAFEAPASPIGRETVEALQSGLVYGFVGQTEGMIARFKEVLGPQTRVVATGGLADVVAEHTAEIDAVEPWLTLEGLKLFWEASVASASPTLR